MSSTKSPSIVEPCRDPCARTPRSTTKKVKTTVLSSPTLAAEEDDGENSKPRTSTPKKKLASMEFLGAGDASSIVDEGQDMDTSKMSTSCPLQEDSSVVGAGSEENGGGDLIFQDSGILKQKKGVVSSLLKSTSSNRSVTFAPEPEIINNGEDGEGGEDDLSRYFADDENGSNMEEELLNLFTKDDQEPEMSVTGEEGYLSSDGLLMIGYLLSVAVLMNHKARWIVDEFRIQGEGHSVSKMAVVLLLLFTYSFVKWGLETLRGINCILELGWPIWSFRIKYWFKGIHKVFIASLLAKLGCIFWEYIWKNYVCKSFHDTSCKNTSIGQWLYDYRNDACNDGPGSSAICEKFISYLPILITTCCVVLVGNLLSPWISDNLEDFLTKVRQEAAEENLVELSKLLKDYKLGSQKEKLDKTGQRIRPHSEILNSSIYEIMEQISPGSRTSADSNGASNGLLNVGFLDQTDDSIRERNRGSKPAKAKKIVKDNIGA